MTTTLTVPQVPKMIREALCVAEHAVNQNVADINKHGAPQVLAALINECDRHRPTGPDGKHGGRHTPTCGCEDVPLPAYAPSASVSRAASALLDVDHGVNAHLYEPRYSSASAIVAAAIDADELAGHLHALHAGSRGSTTCGTCDFRAQYLRGMILGEGQ